MKTEDVAEYFEVSPELLPYIPELLADLWALGSSPETVVEWVRSLELPPETTGVLDLGCGKGAVSIALAKEFNFRIFGIDFSNLSLLMPEKGRKNQGYMTYVLLNALICMTYSKKQETLTSSFIRQLAACLDRLINVCFNSDKPSNLAII